MFADVGRYPAYKESEIPWLGAVPAHWEMRSLGSITRRVSRRGEMNLPLLSVVRERGVVPRSSMSAEENHNFVPDDLTNYQIVEKGDLVINKMKAWQGSLGIAPISGVVSPAYFVLKIAVGNRLFAQALLRSKPYVAFFGRASDGVRIGQWDLSVPEMKRIPVLIPPIEEQEGIIRFLGQADLRIQLFIGAKKKLLSLLEEQRRVIIRKAVTRGLNSGVRVKASEIDLLGDVPAHWSISRVKNEFICFNRRRIPLSATERGEMTRKEFSYYGASGVIDRVDNYLFNDELLLIAEDGANLVLRNLPLAIIARGKFWVNNHAHVLKPRRGSLEFLANLMENVNYLPWISGAAQPKLTQDRLMTIPIAVPPMEEQESITRWLDGETAALKAASDRAARQIGLLREFRASLIADVVTGRVDVRKAAAGKGPPDGRVFESNEDVDSIPEGNGDPKWTDEENLAEEVEM